MGVSGYVKFVLALLDSALSFLSSRVLCEDMTVNSVFSGPGISN